MRINKFLAGSTGISRRGADEAIRSGKVTVNGQLSNLGQDVNPDMDKIKLDGRPLVLKENSKTIIFNKPKNYVCSTKGQGNKTIYDLLPKSYSSLKIAGRLDKDSSGLLLLSNDGQLIQLLTHPKYNKLKRYLVNLDKPLLPVDEKTITKNGIVLEDGLSRLGLRILDPARKNWQVNLAEGRNRQIRRTFGSLGYDITRLHRLAIGPYNLGNLKEGQYKKVIS